MVELTEVKGVSDSRAEDLFDAGYKTVDDVATATVDGLSEVSGIGSSTAEGLIESAQDLIREDTLPDEEDADEQTQEGDEETEEEEDEYNVSEDELRDLVEETPTEEPSIDDANLEDDVRDGEVVNVEVEPPYPVSVALETDAEYDYFLYTLLDLQLGRLNISGHQNQLANEVLNKVRPLGGPGEVSFELNGKDLNALHAALSRAEIDYQGSTNRSAFTAARNVRRQVNAAREKYL